MTPGSSNSNTKDIHSIPPKSASVPSAEDPEFDVLDRRLKHLTDTIWPATPYLLQLPSERPFHANSYQEADLLRGTPFNASEWELQYMSFSAANWDDSLITPVGAWEDDKLDDIGNSPFSQKMQSASGTPKVAAKKISINEYRKRAAGQSAVNGTAKVNGDAKPVETKHAEKTSSSKNSSLVPAQGNKELKRQAKDRGPDGPRDTQDSKREQPSKRPRTSSTSHEAPLRDVGSNTKLSLPGPISPTLPPAFEKRLAEIDDLREDDPKKRKLDNFEKEAKDGALTASAKTQTTKYDVGASRKADFADSAKDLEEPTKAPMTNRARGASTSKESTVNNAQSLVPGSELLTTKSAPKTAERRSEHEAKPLKSKIIRLKISKRIRKRFLAIIQLPQPKSRSSLSGKALAGGSAREGSEASTRDSQSKIIKEEQDGPKVKVEKGVPDEEAKPIKTESTSKPGEKRQRPDHDPDTGQSQNKRQKPTESRTPQAFKSPVLSGRASLKKPRDTTPSTANKEETVTTPQGSIRNGTPAAPSSVERARHTPSASGSSHSTSAEAHDALRVERTKYFELARSLKKESDRIYKAGEPTPPSSVMKKYLAIRLEVTLAFMLAYVVGDEMRRLERQPLRYENTWATLFPWLRQLQQQTLEYPFLRGLSLQLEAVTHLVAWNIENDQAASASSAGGSSEKERPPDNVRALKRHYDEAHRMLVDGSCLLSVDDLQQEFPRTWRSKARKPLAASPPKLTSSTLGGDFYLPISGITLPIEAVRAGKSILGEWCKMEGVEWTPKLNF